MLLQHHHTITVIQFCHILACEGSIFVKILDIFEFFASHDLKLRDLANLCSYKLIMT